MTLLGTIRTVIPSDAPTQVVSDGGKPMTDAATGAFFATNPKPLGAAEVVGEPSGLPTNRTFCGRRPSTASPASFLPKIYRDLADAHARGDLAAVANIEEHIAERELEMRWEAGQ